MKRKYWLLLAVVIQLAMIVVAFHPVIFHPNTYFFDNKYDGLKSLFCWYSYIFYDQPGGDFHYAMLNYPFGEYVFYPDNTPIFCIVLRFIQNLQIIDLQPYAFGIHHYLFLSGFLVSCILLFFILEQMLRSYWLIFLGAIALPWINPQFIRIEFHFNLAYSWILLLQILITIWQYQSITSKDYIRWYKLLAIQAIILFIMPLFHMYYLAMNYAFIGSFWAFYWLCNRDKQSFKVFAVNIMVFTLSAILFLLSVKHYDQFYALRSDIAPGYDWIDWKWRPENLFLRTEWFKIPFIYNYTENRGYETFAYLGTFALYGLFLLPIYIYFKKKVTAPFPRYFLPLFLAGIVLLFISFGEHVVIGKNDYTILNILNPLYYLHLITDKVTHFRCTSRFGWYFFWTFNFLILIIIDRLLYLSANNKWRIFLFGFSSLLLIDLFNTIQWSSTRVRNINIFTDEKEMADIRELFKDIDLSKYQAILPIPYFHGLCSDYDYTIDPDDQMCQIAFQASFLTHLPLMASKIPRIPTSQAKALLETVAYSKVDTSVARLLNDKPILVMINVERYEHGWRPSVPNALKLYEGQKSFMEDERLLMIKSYKSFQLKEWHWQQYTH